MTEVATTWAPQADDLRLYAAVIRQQESQRKIGLHLGPNEAFLVALHPSPEARQQTCFLTDGQGSQPRHQSLASDIQESEAGICGRKTLASRPNR